MACPLGCTGPVRRLFEKGGIPYYRCSGCGFVFSRPPANANLPDRPEDYEPAYLQYFAESAEDDRNHTTLLRWVERFRPVAGRRVLDVGAGSGKFVRFLRTRGADAQGIEPATPLYGRFLAGDPGFHHQTLEQFAARADAAPFAIVFACDVIEHVERPDLFLRDVSGLLQPGGMLFLSTPDVGSPFARLCGRSWHFFNRYHCSYLTPRTVNALGHRHRLRVVDIRHPARAKSIGYLIRYLTDFVAGGGRIRVPPRLNSLVVPVNLFDVMFVALERDGGAG